MLERVVAQSEASQGYIMKGEIRMASALKCDRCKNYFDYSPATKNNFIAFGHKDIVIGKNFPVKDICPDCMEMFMKWFENPDIKDLELVSKLKDAKIHIAQLKLKLGYTMSKEEMDVLEEGEVNETRREKRTC